MNFNLDPTNLFFSIVFGLVGTAYFMYGKKEKLHFLVAGVGLMTYTFVVESTAAVIIWGLVLTLAPFIYDKFME